MSIGRVAGAAAPRHLAVLARLERVERPAAAMAAWGVVAALLTAALLLALAPHPWPMQAARATELRQSLTVINHGGPLLLGRHPNGSLYAVGVTDDQGVFIYIPWITRALGLSDPLTVLRDAYAVMFALTALIYPLVFWRLGRSTVAGVLAPLVLLPCVVSLGFNDAYWIAPWASLTLLPVVFLIADARPRARWIVPAGVALALLAGWVSSLRSEAGLGIVIALALVVLLRRWRWWRVIAAIAVLGAAYWATSAGVSSAFRAHRDARIHTTALSRDQPTGHPFWHTAYIGLGYLANPQGIRYLDGVAIRFVARHEPGARFLSARYETTLRRAYFSILEHHPVEFVKQYGAKVLVTAADAVLYLLLCALVVPWMLIAAAGADRRRRWVLLTLPALALAFLPSVVAIPMQVYEEGLYGTLGLLAILGLTAAGADLARAGIDAGALRAGLALSRRAVGSRVGRTSAVAIALILVLSVAAFPVRRAAERWQGAGFSSGVLIGAVPSASTPSRS